MKRPFSILDLQCDIEGRPVKSDFVKYTDELEKRIKKVLVLIETEYPIIVNPQALYDWWMNPQNDMDPMLSRDNGKTWEEMTIQDMKDTQEEQWKENLEMLVDKIKGTLDPYPFHFKKSIITHAKRTEETQ